MNTEIEVYQCIRCGCETCNCEKRKMKYKGYVADISYSNDDKCLFGKVLFVDDLIIFDGDYSTIEQSFHNAIDEYLETCKEIENNGQ